MAAPTTLPAGDFIIQLETSEGSGVFTAPCGLTSKGFNQTASVQETIVPDCDDPDAAANVERAVDALSREISGSGVLAMASRSTWQTWYDSGLKKKCRVLLDTTLANSGGYWQGYFVLTQFNCGAERGQKVRVEVTMQSDGAITWFNAAA